MLWLLQSDMYAVCDENQSSEYFMSFLCWIQFARDGDFLGDCCFSLKFFLDVCFSAFLLNFTSFFAVLLICFWAYLLICFSFLLFLVFYLSSLNKHQETLYVNTP